MRTLSTFGESLDWQTLVREKVRALRYGSVQILVHQGRVVQIEVTEKVRLEDSTDPSTPPVERVLQAGARRENNQQIPMETKKLSQSNTERK